MATFLHDLFSNICGQGRCFAVDGDALPICQRCLGLYAGAFVTFVFLLASARWRRGLPSRPAVVLHVAAILVAMLGGIHVIDAGPQWRWLCGLWTGHVFTLWLLGSGTELRRAATPRADPAQLRPVVGIRAGMMGIVAAAGLATFAPATLMPSWWPWTLVAMAGFVTLYLLAARCAVLAVLLAICIRVGKAIRPASIETSDMM